MGEKVNHGRGRPLRWLWLSVAVVAADQLAKAAALEWLVVHRPVPVAPSVNLTLTFNTGAAFSFLSGAGGWQRWLFAGFAVAVSAFIVYWLRGVSARERWLAAALALVLGGAVGNLVDRLWRGAVVDFLDLYYGNWHWPAFNVADSAITVGAAILVLQALRGEGGHRA